jgi:hypothetical protein
VIERAVGVARHVGIDAYLAHANWRAGMRSAVETVLVLMEENPGLVRIFVIDALGGGPRILRYRVLVQSELDEVLDANFAVDDEELAKELYSIAAPVRDEARDVVAAVDIAVPSSMISLGELVDALGPHLVTTADRISARLGYRRDDELE